MTIDTAVPARRPRRADSDRAARILDAALECFVELGVGSTTHRAIASRADVPLGSLTYRFPSLGDIVAQSFTRFVEQQNDAYAEIFREVRTREEFTEVLTELVVAAPTRPRSAVLGFELHVAALRNPPLRTLTEGWTRRSREVLGRYLDPLSASRLDALLEGLILHSLLAAEPAPREEARAQIAGAVPAEAWTGERP